MNPLDRFLRNRARKSKGKLDFTSNYLEQWILEGAQRISWREKWHRPGETAGPKKRGIGMALGGYPFRPGLGAATIRINEDGTAHVLVGVTNIGIGAKSTMAIIASEVVRNARVVMGGVAPIPWSAAKAQDFLRGKKLDEGTARQTGEIALEGARPLKDNGYKVKIAQDLIQRGLLASV